MKKKVVNILSIVLVTIVSILSVLLLVKNIFFFEILVVGDSMRATLKEGEIGIAIKDTFVSNFDKGDIIIFEKDGKEIVKRIIAEPNDHIKITPDGVYVNGEFVEENYVTSKNKKLTYLANGYHNELTLKENEYYVMGDNRGESYDSRYYGSITEDDITGKLKMIYARGDCTDSSCDKLENSGFVPFRFY